LGKQKDGHIVYLHSTKFLFDQIIEGKLFIEISLKKKGKTKRWTYKHL